VREGVRLAVDVGKVRVGVARSDREGLMALPVATVPRDVALQEIALLVTQWQPLEIIVGLPLGMSGEHTASTRDALEFAEQLVQAELSPVRMVDERLSTVSATSALHASGKATKKHRPLVDQVAAVILLQHTLDSERSQGVAVGTLLESRPKDS
jgi:putative holliday junction resolvase